MGAFGEGFATGFFNKLSEGIDTRNADARDYFNKQVETARTLGLENRRRSSAMIDESVSVAKRLQAMGVPKDIIMSQAQMDPAGLGDFYAQADKLRLEANVTVDDAFWRDIYDLAGTFQAPDEDFNTFFSKMYGPIIQAAKEDPEGFKQDPKGTIWARLFSGNAMDKARDRLATTEVVPGMTAEQAIAQGDTPRPNKVGGESFVTVDPEALRKAAGKADSLTPQVMEAIRADFDEIAAQAETELTDQFNTDDPEQLRPLKQAAKAAAYEKIKELYGGDEKYLAYIRARYNLDEEGLPIGMEQPATAPTEALTEPSPEEATTDAPETDEAVEASPRPVTDPSESKPEETSSVPEIKFVDGGGNPVTLVFVSNNLNGTATYKDAASGKLLTYPISTFKELENR